MSARSPFRRTLLVFGLLLIGPAAGLAWLGWRSLLTEERARRAEATTAARDAAERTASLGAAFLEEVRRTEEKRPYYHYQPRFMPEDVKAAGGPAFVESPLVGRAQRAADEPGAWFQWTTTTGRVIGPEVFASGGTGAEVRATLAEVYGPSLPERLRAAAQSVELRSASPVAVPLPVVAANEEIGSLLEEIDVAQRENRQTAYLENFNERVQQRQDEAAPLREASIDVRYTPFRYLSGGGAASRLPLVAWRLVWVPGVAKRQRAAPVDRWLLQGYVVPVPVTHLNALRADTTAARRETIGPAAWNLGGGGPGPLTAADLPWGHVASLATRLPIEFLDVEPWALSFVSRPDLAAVSAAERQERMRFFLVAGGLVAVIGIGFFVLARSVRREVDVARRKEDFVAAVTHELKTPLTGIRMYADMLREGWSTDPDASSDYAARIGAEAQRLDALVDQVLALAAYDHGVASFKPVPGDLGEAVRSAVSMLEPKAAEAGVPVRVEVEDGLPLVPFDPALMRGIVLNLVDNAVKYSARSEAKDVLVRVRRDGPRVTLAVADRGAGIPAKDRKRVFEPFYRAGREETRSAPGAGIGLALVRRYADAHGAKIALESEEGRGTTVTVSFVA
jgi:signal transduction histidine kinase